MAYEKTNDLKVLERFPNCVLFTNGFARFNGRLSYCYAVDGQEQKNDAGVVKRTWSSQLLIPKAWDDCKVLAVRRMKEQIKEAKIEGLAPERKWFRDGDKKKIGDTGMPDLQAKDHWIISARAYNPVTLFGPRTDPKTGKAEQLEASPQARALFYGGAQGALIVSPWYQDGKKNPANGKRLNAELVAVQFRKHDDPLGAGRISADKMGAGFDTSDTGGWDDDEDDGLGGDADDDGL